MRRSARGSRSTLRPISVLAAGSLALFTSWGCGAKETGCTDCTQAAHGSDGSGGRQAGSGASGSEASVGDAGGQGGWVPSGGGGARSGASGDGLAGASGGPDAPTGIGGRRDTGLGGASGSGAGSPGGASGSSAGSPGGASGSGAGSASGGSSAGRGGATGFGGANGPKDAGGSGGSAQPGALDAGASEDSDTWPPACQGLVPGDEAKALVQQGAVLLDVRGASEFASGHIDGAINLPVDAVASRMSELDPSTPIVAYCQSGHRAEQAADQLCAAGYRVYELGPMSNWPK